VATEGSERARQDEYRPRRDRPEADEDWIVRGHDHPVAGVLERSCRAAGYPSSLAILGVDSVW
jgi:hypothetical protein